MQPTLRHVPFPLFPFPFSLVPCPLLRRLPPLRAQFPRADYAFRIFVDKRGWSAALSSLAEETDYDNFKSEAARHQGPAGAAYERSLHDVWSVMFRLQK